MDSPYDSPEIAPKSRSKLGERSASNATETLKKNAVGLATRDALSRLHSDINDLLKEQRQIKKNR